jgi:hypothetical protein
MTTSGISTFSATRNDIIRQAALKINAISANVTTPSQMLADFSFMLNGLMKHYQSTGLHIWTETEGTLFLKAGQTSYAVGSGATDHCTRTQTLVQNTLSLSRAIANTFFFVTSTTGFVVGYKIGIVLDGGSIFWSTITAVATGSVTIADPTTDSVTLGNAVFCYQSDIELPIKILNPRRYNIVSFNEVPILNVPRKDFVNLANRTNAGLPNQIFYDRQIGTGYINVSQVPLTTSELIRFTWHRPIQDFSTAADNPDLPQEWIMTLVYNLAVIMSPEYPVAPIKLRTIEQLAMQFLGDVQGSDRETESVIFAPGMR